MSLQVNGLTKYFGQKRAVNQITFSMTEPGVFGLIGTNGAGKTTTIRMILGIMPPTSGSASWDGRKITRETLNFGYMPEERGIYLKNPVLEQLIYFGQLHGMSYQDAKSSAMGYLERLGMAEHAKTIVEKLSKGNQQKIQLVSTLVHNPTLIFLDEPFSGLDPVNTDVLRKLLQELIEEGKYIVMSSHQMETVEEYCRDILILHHGDTVLQGNLAAIKAGYGHTNLVLNASEDVAPIAAKLGIELIERRAGETEWRIQGDESARALLGGMIAQGIYPTKFEIREPSLSEIFLEKVGAYAEREGGEVQ